ncbi:uncharacterized protein LOC110840264 isoform X2 [Zootermopsis nevadensis]|nr:uncharacterized protein LOC110840264 isoform X2 [Zootermopsis nevadensis]
MEGEEENLVQWTLSQISDKANAKISIKECEDSVVMVINSKLAGVPFTIQFCLKVMTSHDLYKEITLPLLLMVQQLQAQKRSLFDLVKKKDIEITQYKLEGAQLSRGSIETAAFVEDQFEQSRTAIQIPGGFPAQPVSLFTQEIQNLYVDVIKNYENSKELKEAAQQNADTEGSGTQRTFSNSSPEKKRNHNLKPEENDRDHRHEKKEEDKLLIKHRKEAVKKKRLNL